MTDLVKSKTHPQHRLPDMERVNLITDALSHKEPLTQQAYKALLQEIHHRYQRNNADHYAEMIAETSPQISEGIEVSFAEAEQIDTLEHVARSSESFLNQLGPIGSFLANGIGVLVTPWQCVREKRWPTKDEGIKLGVSAAAIVLTAIAVAVPVTATAMFIAIAVGSIIKGAQTIKIKQEELHRLRQLATHGRQEIQRVHDDIDLLKKVTSPTQEQRHELTEKTKELTRLTDQFVQDGYAIHQLEEEHHHPFRAISHHINVAMSAVALVGIVLSIFMPPVGGALIIASGVISLASLAVSVIAKRWANRSHQTNSTTAAASHHSTNSVTKPAVEQPTNEHTDSLQQTKTPLQPTAHTAPETQTIERSITRPIIAPHYHEDALARAQEELGPEKFQPLSASDPELINKEKEEQQLRQKLQTMSHTSMPEQPTSPELSDKEQDNLSEPEP